MRVVECGEGYGWCCCLVYGVVIWCGVVVCGRGEWCGGNGVECDIMFIQV